MATIQDRINRTRRLCFASENQYSNDAWLEDVNFIIKDIQQSIDTYVNDGYFWDIWLEDLVTWQEEYKIVDAQWVVDVKIKRIDEVYVKYSGQTNYQKATQIDIFHLDEDLEVYKTGASRIAPFFYIKDRSFFLYPTEDTTGTFTNGAWDTITWVQDWLKVHFRYIHPDVSLTTTDDELLLPKDYLHLIDAGIKQFVYVSQNKINEKNDAINEYNNLKDAMVRSMNERYNQPQQKIVDFTHLRRYF